MSLPNKLTVVRLILSPIMLVAFFIPVWTGTFAIGSVVVCWLVLAVIETTDVLDGHLARRWDLITDFGKVLDPFADVVSRVTYFICFTGVGVMPIWVLAIIVYRELGVTFLRLVQSRRGIAMAASIWGKLKAVFYAVSGVAGLLVVTFDRASWFLRFHHLFLVLTQAIFIIAAVAAVGSFFTYLRVVIAGERAER